MFTTLSIKHKGKNMSKIQEHKGNLLAVKKGYIIHGCNTLGVMGAGVALAIKEMYPLAYEKYVKDLDTLATKKGSAEAALGFNSSLEVDVGLTIVNAFTQDRTGRNPDEKYVKYWAISACFRRLRALVEKQALADLSTVKEVHFPLIGCGLANGKWEVVSALIEEAFEGSDIELHLWTI